jgi:flagellar motor protein MotB
MISVDRAILDAARESAARLAAAGEYPEALRVLDAGGDALAELPETLDLRARIHAQAGSYADAIVAWKTLLGLDPENESARRGIARAEALSTHENRRPGRRRWLIASILTTGAVTAIAIFSFGLGRWSAASTAAIDGMTRIESGQLRLEEQLSQLSRRIAREPVEASLAVTARDHMAVFAQAGLHVENIGAEISIRFEDDLFGPGSAYIRDDRRAMIELVANRLSELRGPFAVEVTGKADSHPLHRGSRFRDNESLSFARAMTVADLLRRTSKISPAVFSAVGSEPVRVANTLDSVRTVEVRIRFSES